MAVADTGTGIPDRHLDAVTEKFHQVRENHLRPHEGAGLGLAIVETLIKLHGGSLSIDSTVGKGTTVTLYFPPERTA